MSQTKLRKFKNPHHLQYSRLTVIKELLQGGGLGQLGLRGDLSLTFALSTNIS